MDTKTIQEQMNQLNKKMDLVLEAMNQQHQKSEQMEDLFADLQIVGKDIYDTAVIDLENQQVELDIDQLKHLGLKLLTNVEDITIMLSLFESLVDFARDAGPIFRELIIDSIKRLNELEKKGYFDFFRELGRLVDILVNHFTKGDMALLADNVVIVAETIQKVTQPEIMKTVQNVLGSYNELDKEHVPEYSLIKLIREFNRPEMKKMIGLMVSIMTNLYKREFG